MYIDRKQLRTNAFQAITNLLKKLHMFRSTGDYDSANLLFKQYSSFDSEMSKV